MNSFTLTAVGNLARNPEAVAKGDVTYTRFCLVGNDYAGKDEEGSSREIVTSLWFVAFGSLGETIVRNARKGDKLIVEARVRANNWTDKQGEKQYDHAFVVQGFRFGAPGRVKREELEQRREESLRRGDERGAGPEGYLNVKAGANGDAGMEGSSGTNGGAGMEGGSAGDGSLDVIPEPKPEADKGGDSTNGKSVGNGATKHGHEKQTAQRGSRRATPPPP